MKALRITVSLTVWTALLLVPTSIAQTSTSTQASVRGNGSIIGFVSNAATRTGLEGAVIEISALGITTRSDNSGRFVLVGLPAGVHEVSVSYIGLDTAKTPVAVSDGQRTTQDFALTSSIYKLDAFKVTGEREGNALALTMQRNAENVKNVVAMDSFGNLPNMSVGEVVMRLPGVAPITQDEGLNYAIQVRGMPGNLNTVTMDGQRMPSIGTNRALELHTVSATLYEQMEMVKGLTPDASADSLGGNLNLKTRSTLNMKEKRRVNFSATVRAAPPFTEQIPLREEHRYHPLFTVTYQEVFSILGGDRNLGVQVNARYSENAIGGVIVNRNYQNTTDSPAYVWDYSVRNNFNNRKQTNANVKTEYRLSDNSKFTVNTLFNHNIERMRRGYTLRAYTGSATAVPSATSTVTGINPGWTETMTSVRPLSTANYLTNAANNTVVDVSTTGPNSYIVRQWLASFAGDHTFGPIKLDYNTGYSRNNQKTGQSTGGAKGGQYTLTHRVTGIGWILESPVGQDFSRLIQTAGPDIANPSNYRPIDVGLSTAVNTNDQYNKHFNADLIYTLPTAAPIIFKTGFTWRQLEIVGKSAGRRWSYLGTSALPTNSSVELYGTFAEGKTMPVWQVSDFMNDRVPKDQALWREDLYFNRQLGYTANRGVTEDVTAGYAMFKGRFANQGWLRRTGFLGGVRQEKTETESYGWVRARSLSTAAQQLADPDGAARRDYDGNRRILKGSYTKSFPSLHLHHDITPNVKARLSWSTGFGRAPPANLMPNETPNETNQTVTVNNPSLLPQMATNWDATLEYYFEPVGSLTVGWFHKKITDYIVTGIDNGIVPTGPNNGFNGEYEGFRLLTALNAGTAIVKGWEVSYQQQFTFLPGLWKGLGAMINYTQIETEGDFGSLAGARRKTGEVAGFVPKLANIMLSWSYRRFSTRIIANYNSAYISTFSATNAGANIYRYSRTSMDLGFGYQLNPKLTLTLDLNNFTEEPQSFYQYVPSRYQAYTQNFLTITAGVSGRF
jgi:TonB-dependent receptor